MTATPASPAVPDSALTEAAPPAERAATPRRRPAGAPRDLALVSVFFTVAAIGMTWPLAANFATHIPGDGGDAPMFVWNLWWVKHALLDRWQWPFATDFIFYPHGVNLSFHTLTTLHGLLSIPVQYVAGAVVAANVLFLWSLAASGVGAWALARYGGASRSGALAAGVIFAFSPWVFAQARGHYNLSSTWMLPIFALCLLRALDGGRLRWAVAAGAALAATALNEYQYGAFGLVLMALVAPFRRPLWPGPELLVSLRLLVVTTATTVLLLSPLLASAARHVLDGVPVADRVETAIFFSADLTGFLTPSGLRWGGRPEAFLYGTDDFAGIGGADATVYLGWAGVMLALAGLAAGFTAARIRVRWVALWATVAAVFLLLALGPYLHVFGRDAFEVAGASWRVPLPYLALTHVPVIGTTRVPSRYTVMAMLALAMLAAVGLDALRAALAAGVPRQYSALARAAVVGTALFIILADVSVAPLWLQPVAPSPFYWQIAAEPGDFAVLELPLGQSVGPRTVSGQVEPLLQYYQTVHGKRLFNGHASRERPEQVEPLRQRAGFGWLVSNGATLPNGNHVDAAEVRATFWELDVRYAIVHPSLFADLSAKSRVQEYLESYLGADEVYRDNDIVAYRIGAGVRRPPADEGIVLLSPAEGGLAEGRTPLLRWTPADVTVKLEQVQISLDRDFGPRGFLYFETLDSEEAEEPHSYHVPEQYPLEPGRRYYWRVRSMGDGTPGLWSRVGAFWTPDAAE